MTSKWMPISIGVVGLLLSGARVTHGQDSPARLTFGVVSIKPTPKPNQGAEMMECRNDRFVSREFPIAFAVRWSYQLNSARIVGMPDWTSDWNAGYDIEAKAPRPVTQEECRQLVRQLLADRFGMVSHPEVRSMQAYILTVTDGGKKLRELTREHRGATINRQPVGDLADNQGLSMHRLAELLGAHPRVGMPVIDKSGLDARFSFDLTFSLRDDDGAPSVFAALRELGLKLDSTKAPLEVLVVDHIGRAGSN